MHSSPLFREPVALASLLFCAGLMTCATTEFTTGQEFPKTLLGDWSLNLDSGEPGWLSIAEEAGKPIVSMRIYVGSMGPYRDVEVHDGRLQFRLGKSQSRGAPLVTVGIAEDGLDGLIHRAGRDGFPELVRFTGIKIPPAPSQPPDLSKVRFGHPIALFNGRDLTGWTPHELDKKNGWSVQNGHLTNTTPKTDFSATGDHANLKTTAVFEDFWLHIEFLVEPQRNSGVYLRGMYEAQVVDRDSRMQGIQGVGAIFGTIAPSKNAGKPGGEWQTYDITLVDRHVTVVLNGEKVIDNQPLPHPTAGAIQTNPLAAGPIYLQGDHTNVRYRNIYLAPEVRD